MKKVLLLSLLLCSLSAWCEELIDGVKLVKLEEVIVSSNRAKESSPTVFSNVSVKQIKRENASKNIPFILQSLPSVVAFSEDGSGVGNTSLRIRGTDATRINVTLNGMPMNNPESQEVYWVNIPDISNSLQSIQLQRGVGTSTNGSAAFGASLSLKTIQSRQKAYGEASTAIGSYNTFTSTIAAGSGILDNGLSLDLRYSRVTGDGYIRNGKVNHHSAYASLAYFSDSQVIRLIYMNGVQHTGITWEGINPEQMKTDRKYNPAGEYYDDAGNLHYYDNETDNYYSDIAQFIYTKEFTNNLMLNVNINYNHGYGYYENYKTGQKFKKFGLEDQTTKDGVTHSKADIIRRKLMSNDFYVANTTLSYSINSLSLTGGLMYSYFDGDHYGKLRWVKYNQNIPNNFEWYRNNSDKQEFSSFIKAEYTLLDQLILFGDLQYRYIGYRMKGLDDDLVDISGNNYYSFFNPKAGVSYNINSSNNVYASIAIANREPLRTDLKEYLKGGIEHKIKSERMFDYELGYRFANAKAFFNANLYYMHYKDQMVQTGKLNDVGYKFMENVPKSYRMGIELSGGYRLVKWLRADANLTFSRNKIKDYKAYIYIYDNNIDWNYINSKESYIGTTDISFSPSIVGSGTLTFSPYKDLDFIFSTKYVGKQYLDNTSDKNFRLDDYFIGNLSAGYTFDVNKIGKIDVQFFVNNIFNKRYAANGWGSSTDQFEDGSRSIGLYPQATRNIMAKLGFKF